MNAVELRELKDIIRECEQLKHENADLRSQIYDLKTQLASFNLLNINKKEVEEA